MRLEKMDAFFEARLNGYEEHMMNSIESAEAFYYFTAAQLPIGDRAQVLDLGCGTGLEMDWYFQNNPTAAVTGIDFYKGSYEDCTDVQNLIKNYSNIVALETPVMKNCSLNNITKISPMDIPIALKIPNCKVLP